MRLFGGGEKSSQQSLEHRTNCWLLCRRASGVVRKEQDSPQTDRAGASQTVHTVLPKQFPKQFPGSSKQFPLKIITSPKQINLDVLLVLEGV